MEIFKLRFNRTEQKNENERYYFNFVIYVDITINYNPFTKSLSSLEINW